MNIEGLPAELADRAQTLGAKYALKVIDDDGKPHFAFLKKAKRHTIEQCMGMVSGVGGAEPRLIDAGEMVLRDGWIAEVSDAAILENEDLLISASFSAYKTIQIRLGELEKF